MLADGIYALPACDRVCTNDGMNSFKLAPYILNRSARLFVEFEAAALSSSDEIWSTKSGCESLQELLIVWRETVIEFVTRSP